ncbi:Barstar, RNAse (barnase) inhibitor [Catalinimonas alkaloidigena]|uniref:Barstar, RNAse (Barnase) inhibitor n=1 Tax=Catalinimonas alkaloidigena TaxID=1075417 RepID=A0A1G9AEW4_9BACT|nr:barstar family protein [Catalinimonas alkaloidigena]SDK25907.1 Barstar, RNAse (barnase) inhibitor [Catalinimonas alkaloidigena]
MRPQQEPAADIQLIQDSSIILYRNNGFLDEDLVTLSKLNYHIIDINVAKWNIKHVHKHLKEALGFPGYYGENLNAFNDCLRDLYDTRFRGLVLVFRRFDNLTDQSRSFCEALLDIIAHTSRNWSLTGYFFIGMFQSNDPDLEFGKLGGINPQWNSQE